MKDNMENKSVISALEKLVSLNKKPVDDNDFDLLSITKKISSKKFKK